MATLVLQAAGAAVGSFFGPLGTIVGRAVGALAGNVIDNAVFGSHRVHEGPRLTNLTVQGSREGTPIPRVYGRVRIAGQVIWATRFEEVATDSGGGKGGGGGGGGDTTRTYSYYANFAVALCEGPIARVGRVWADGKPFDLSTVTHRIYPGNAGQGPDSLILAKQDDTPAYRDTAYIVFERMPIADFGNRLPQLSFEVIRPVAGIEQDIRAVSLIPGSTEFEYDPEPVRETLAPGKVVQLNRHVYGASTDWEAALDELQAVCPNLQRVSLVVTWFGNDLRANSCILKPGVVDTTKVTSPDNWAAAGIGRAGAHLVSTYEGHAAYGGTPTDVSVVRAIQSLHERGLAVTFYPFVMMDIPAGNGLTDPYGGAEQGAHPWRGVMTLSLAPGQPGSPDKTASAAGEIAAFVGTAAPGDFSISGGAVSYSGPDEWTFRRMILHYANLCQAAGGVEAFLIGSELVGLTTARSGASTYPFVDALVDLASDVRGIVGASTRISYGADWSEYFGHHPNDGSGDVYFHLDPLWSSANVDFVGIDNYVPLSDWRDGRDHIDGPLWDSGIQTDYLASNVAGGEDYDWYYASAADRDAQVRTPITDGAYGKPWVFRAKDLASWWGNAHFDRPGGVEAGLPTGWMPQSKPIWFTEIGCPAVDKGPNQPNVFPDAKSSFGGIPYYSSGLRDDSAQRRYIAATLRHWQDDALNLVAAVTGERMVERSAIHFWTYDTRPFPAFPLLTDEWADGGNWETGHWLNGRLGALAVDALVRAVLADYGISAEVGDIDGTVDGFLIGQTMSARQALEPLAQLLGFDAYEADGIFTVVARERRTGASFGTGDLAEEGKQPVVKVQRAQETELPSDVSVGFADVFADFRATSVNSRRLVGGSKRSEGADTGLTLAHEVATALADRLLQDLWAGRETISLALPPSDLTIEPTDICLLDLGSEPRRVRITRVEDAGLRRIEAQSLETESLPALPAIRRTPRPVPVVATSKPEVMLLDLPLLTGSEPGYAPRVAVFADPWPGAVTLSIGTATSGFTARQTIERSAVVGELTAPLAAGPIARFDRANAVEVRLYGGALAGYPELSLLNGANAAAIGSAETGFEVVQFENAEQISADTWRLTGLLRGQGGTFDLNDAGHDTGARFVLLDGAVRVLALSESESGLGLTLRCGPTGAIYDPETFTDVTLGSSRRGLMCLAPVHVSAIRDGGTGDVAIGWIRQTRIGGDGWDPVEVPLGETSEAYTVAILDGATTVRIIDAGAPTATYAAADQVADFGSLPSSISIAIRQVSPTEGPGLAASRVINV